MKINRNDFPQTLSAAALVVIVALTTSALVGWLWLQARQGAAPDFTTMPAGDARKSAFVDFLVPIIEAQNAWRQQDRRRLEALQPDALSSEEIAWLQELAGRYELDPEQSRSELIARLLTHVDAIPPSLALAQAAKESGWGTSRFATEGNNFFGERCWEAGCGIVPDERSDAGSFEVRRFESVEASVSSYMRNINTHPDYAPLRESRARMRSRNEPLSGTELAELLGPYSERRESYTQDIRTMIEQNELEAFQ